ncbi:MAG: ribosome maturation factor RimM [Bacilli bacterium]|jgi:16S rRNA processing protein RimM
MDYISIGKIISTIGLRGEVKVFVVSDFPEKRFKKGQEVRLVNEGAQIDLPSTIATARKDKDRYAVTFADIQSIEEAEKYLGSQILIAKDRDQLSKGFYFHDDLVGCQVYDEVKNYVGIVSKVEDYPAHRTLRVHRDDNKDVLVPFVRFFIKDVKIEEQTITVKIIEGML